MASVCLARGTKVGVLHRSPFPREATAPLQERMRTNLFGRPGPMESSLELKLVPSLLQTASPLLSPKVRACPSTQGAWSQAAPPSPQLLTHAGGCGGLKGSASSGAGGGWVPQMMGGPSPPHPPNPLPLAPALGAEEAPGC